MKLAKMMVMVSLAFFAIMFFMLAFTKIFVGLVIVCMFIFMVWLVSMGIIEK